MSNPLLTLFVCAFNQEKFIRKAVEGALAQTYSPLEIILSDDCSADGTFGIMEEMAAAYRGPHQIVLNRNTKNLGIGGHVNRIVELSHGELLIGAAGDDISFKDRTERLYRAWVESSGTAYSIYSDMVEIDSAGREKGIWHKDAPPIHIASVEEAVRRGAAPVFGCSHAFHRETFELFGPMDESVVHEDHAIPFRSLLLGTIKYIPEPLLYYRRHEGNAWSSAAVPTLERRRQVLQWDRAQLVSWLRDLRKANAMGIMDTEKSAHLQGQVIERLHEKTVEGRFYDSPLPGAFVTLFSQCFGWKMLKQMLRPVKRRWQSERGSRRSRRANANTI
jgi:glycosyltransferase involved in cell wall biosynthesis